MRFVLGALLSLFASAAVAQVPLQQDRSVFMPGSQPGAAKLLTATWCDNCHGDYDKSVEPAFNFRGSMMAQAGRDPLWLAAMVVAEQDSLWLAGNVNAGSLCLRCHAPAAWLAGRVEPLNRTAMTMQEDHEGVSCDLCHRMVDPLRALRQPDVAADAAGAASTEAQKTYDADLPVLSALKLFDGSAFYDPTTGLPRYYGTTLATSYAESAGGQYVVDPAQIVRGPRFNAVAMHTSAYSRFHRSRNFCGTCHDVSNAPMENAMAGAGSAERRAAAGYMHLERTFSEYMSSDFARSGVRCQDCHMPRVAGSPTILPGVPWRTDVAKHEFTGGNAWITKILSSVDKTGPGFDATNYAILSGQKYAGAKLDVNGLQRMGSALRAGSERAVTELRKAATLRLVSGEGGVLRLRIINESGHKLISGFPEGRRLWLNVRFYDAAGAVMSEVNPYEPLVVRIDSSGNEQYVSGGTLRTTHEQLVYEARMSSTPLAESDSFHFVLVTGRTKDNRIPPRGFDLVSAAARLALPRVDGADAVSLFTSEEYAGGYDEISLPVPQGATRWRATLFYQTTSKEYVEFLRDEINGSASSLKLPAPSGVASAYVVQTDPFFAPLKDWGRAIWDLWLHNGGAEPVPIATLTTQPMRRRGTR